MANNSGPNKRLNGPDGRVRNTSTSNEARIPGVPKGGGPLPTVKGLGTSYGSAAGMAGSLAGAWSQLQNVAGSYEAMRKGSKAAFKSERARIRQEAIGAMSDAINGSIEGGMTGSSDAMAQRSGVLGQRRADIISAKTGMQQEILQGKVAVQEAYMGMEIAQGTADMQAEAARQAAALQQQAIDAQASQAAAMLNAYKNRAGGTVALAPGTKIMGKPVLTTPQGNWKVGGLTFAPGTPLAQIRAAIQADRQATMTGNLIEGRVASGRM